MDFNTALINANKLYCNDGWSNDEEEVWNEKREAYIQLIMELKRNSEVNDPNNIFISRRAADFKGMYYQDAVQELINAGFTNIETVELNEKAGLFQKSGSIEHINIGGETDFSTDAYFNKDTKIVIYHYLDE